MYRVPGLLLPFMLAVLACPPGNPAPDIKPPPEPPADKPCEERTVIVNTSVTVPESSPEVNTGVDVSAGDCLTLVSSGSIWAGVLLTGNNGPNGWTNVDHDPKFPLHQGPDAHPYALIGMLRLPDGSGEWFFVGTQKAFQHQGAEARLILRTNDDTPNNGSGSFTTNIIVRR